MIKESTTLGEPYLEQKKINLALDGAKKILNNLGLNTLENHRLKGKAEHLLIVTNGVVDNKVVEAFAKEGKKMTDFVHIIHAGDPFAARTSNGLSADEQKALKELDGCIANEEVDAVVILADNTEHFRRDIVYEKIYDEKVRARGAECPGLTLDSLSSLAVFADLDEINERNREAAKVMREVHQLHIKDHNNKTDLYLEFSPTENVHFDPPDLRQRIPKGQRGRGANFPTGEVWFNPRPGKTNGKIVLDNIDTSVPSIDKTKWDNNGLVDQPITLTVVNGIIKEINGGVAAESLARYIEEKAEEAKASGLDPESVRYFGVEIGLGSNPFASTYNESLNVGIIEAEKTPYRFHIALGHSQPEYPYMNYSSAEYVKAPIHLDFTIPEEYEISAVDFAGNDFTIFGSAGRLDRYRERSGFNILAQDKTVSEEVLKNGIKRMEKRLDIKLPPDIFESLGEFRKKEILEVLEALGEVELIEYKGESGKNQMILTQGVHGEETLPNPYLTIDVMDGELRRSLEHLRGNILLIRNINSIGFKDKHRGLFWDEFYNNAHKQFNFNDVCDRFKTGKWEEFFALQTKTEMYAWLVMKYIVGKRDEHKEAETMLIDVHRTDRYTLPTMYLDWYPEGEATYNKLIEGAKDIHIPQFMGLGTFAKDRLYELFSSSAIAQGMLAYTIEEGLMYRPESWPSFFVTAAIFDFLVHHKIIESGKRRFRRKGFYQLEVRTKEFTRHQRTKDVEYVSFKSFLGAPVIREEGKSIEPKEFLNKIMENNPQALVSVEFDENLAGIRGPRENLIVCKGLYGKKEIKRGQNRIEKPDFIVTMDKLGELDYVVSVQETLYYPNKIMHFGFFFDGTKLELRGLDIFPYEELPDGQKPLTAEKLKEILDKYPNLKLVDLDLKEASETDLKLDLSNLAPEIARQK